MGKFILTPNRLKVVHEYLEPLTQHIITKELYVGGEGGADSVIMNYTPREDLLMGMVRVIDGPKETYALKWHQEFLSAAAVRMIEDDIDKENASIMSSEQYMQELENTVLPF